MTLVSGVKGGVKKTWLTDLYTKVVRSNKTRPVVSKNVFRVWDTGTIRRRRAGRIILSVARERCHHSCCQWAFHWIIRLCRRRCISTIDYRMDARTLSSSSSLLLYGVASARFHSLLTLVWLESNNADCPFRKKPTLSWSPSGRKSFASIWGIQANGTNFHFLPFKTSLPSNSISVPIASIEPIRARQNLAPLFGWNPTLKHWRHVIRLDQQQFVWIFH